MADPFNIRLEQLGKELEGDLQALAAAAAFASLSTVVLATPVGNPSLWQNPVAPPGYVGGRARGNWQVAIGVPNDAETGRVDGGGSVTIQTGRGTVAGYRLGPLIYVFNNVPYIGRLNDGFSSQAPAGFVERAIDAALRSIDNARILGE